MGKKLDYAADAQVIRELHEGGLSIRQILRETDGWSFHRVRMAVDHLNRSTSQTEEIEQANEVVEKPKKKAPRITHIPTVDAELEPGIVHRFIVSGAQDDTPVFEPFLRNLEAYAEQIDAHIFIGGYTYQLGLFEDHAAEANIYDSLISQYLCHDRVQLTPDLLYLGSANVLPTTANPLNGWTTANRGGHVVIPHSRVALESIPRMQSQPPRYATTTGTVTMPNYTARAAGQKSLFHHTFGALLIEIDVDGEVFMRHLLPDENGAFQDLDMIVSNGRCTIHERVKAITWGDIHHEQLDAEIALASFGVDMKTSTTVTGDNLLDALRPEFQFLHDTLDFRRRNHHDVKDPHQRAWVLKSGTDNVEDEVGLAAKFVNAVRRDWCITVMVESNHDAALSKWLKCPEGMADPQNAYYWHGLNAAWHDEIRAGNDAFNVVERAMRDAGLGASVAFVPSGGSYMLCDVECGLHGDLGVGGSRGSPNQYRRFGPRTSSGHTHTPKIVEGVYVAGVSAKLDQGYNKGPTTWAHAHIVLYHHGKRALICMSADGRFRAMGDRTSAFYPMETEMELAA